MKIEILEQLIASWLKHIKDCRIVQTNWSPSPLNVEIKDEKYEELSAFIGEIKDVVKDDDLDIFKKSTVKQFVLQCEIDVVGIKICDTVIDELYLVDSAFHEDRLGYKKPVATILKKILRAIVVSDLVFNKIPANIIFVSPKCGDTLKKKIFNAAEKLKDVVKKYYPDSTVKILFNEDFTAEIYEPFIQQIDNISDDNDLFLRSMKLSEIARGFASKSHTKGAIASARTQRGENKDTVLRVLNNLKANGKLTGKLLSDLCDTAYTKKHFNISTFPVLISVADFANSGYEECRFYSKEYIDIGGERYKICSQWIPEKIRKLEAWYNNIISGTTV